MNGSKKEMLVSFFAPFSFHLLPQLKSNWGHGGEKGRDRRTEPTVGKESACSAGDPSSIPGSGRSAGEGIGYPTPVFLGFPCGSAGKESACNVRDLGSIPGLG